MNIETLIEHASKTASQIFKAEGEVQPMVHYVRGDGEHVIAGLPWHNQAEKEGMIAVLREIFKREHVQAYVLIAEAWMAVLKPGEAALAGAASSHPERTEVLLFTGEDETGQVQARMPILRYEGAVQLGALIVERPDNLQGTMAGLLPRARTLQ